MHPLHADIGVLGAQLRRHLVPEDVGETARVRFRDAHQVVAPLASSLERVSNDPLDRHAAENRDFDGNLIRGADVDPSAGARVLPLGVFSDEQHVDVGRTAAEQGRGRPREEAHRPQVHVLLEPLSNRKEEAPEADVIGDGRPADRAEVDRIEPPQDIEAVGRHHLTGLLVVRRSPGERLEFQLWAHGLERFESLGDHLRTDAVTRNHGDPLAHGSIFALGSRGRPRRRPQRVLYCAVRSLLASVSLDVELFWSVAAIVPVAATPPLTVKIASSNVVPLGACAAAKAGKAVAPENEVEM